MPLSTADYCRYEVSDTEEAIRDLKEHGQWDSNPDLTPEDIPYLEGKIDAYLNVLTRRLGQRYEDTCMHGHPACQNCLDEEDAGGARL